MLRHMLLVVFLGVFCISARNPFSVKRKKTFTVCTLKGTIIGDKPFAHIGYEGCDLILGIGEEVAGLVITEIDCDGLVLKNKNGATWRLEVDKFMKIGEGA